jgi:hypothetical protein
MSIMVVVGGIGVGQTLEDAIQKAITDVQQLPSALHQVPSVGHHDQDQDRDRELDAAAEQWLVMSFGGATGPSAEQIRDRIAQLASATPMGPVSYMTTTQGLGLPEGPETGTAWSTVRGAFTRLAHGHRLLIETGHPMRANQRGGSQQDTTYRFDAAAAAAVAAALARRPAPTT